MLVDPQVFFDTRILLRITDYAMWIAAGVIIGLVIRSVIRVAQGHSRPTGRMTAIVLSIILAASYVGLWHHFGMIPTLEPLLWATSHALVLAAALFWILRRWDRPPAEFAEKAEQPPLLIESDDVQEIERRRTELATRLTESLEQGETSRVASARLRVDANGSEQSAKSGEALPWLEGQPGTREAVPRRRSRAPAGGKARRKVSKVGPANGTQQTAPAGGRTAQIPPRRTQRRQNVFETANPLGPTSASTRAHAASTQGPPAAAAKKPKATSTPASPKRGAQAATAPVTPPASHATAPQSRRGGSSHGHVAQSPKQQSTQERRATSEVAPEQTRTAKPAATKIYLEKTANGTRSNNAPVKTSKPAVSPRNPDATHPDAIHIEPRHPQTAAKAKPQRPAVERPTRTNDTDRRVASANAATEGTPAAAPASQPGTTGSKPARYANGHSHPGAKPPQRPEQPRRPAAAVAETPVDKELDNRTALSNPAPGEPVGVLDSPPLALSKKPSTDSLEKLDHNNGQNNFLNPTRATAAEESVSKESVSKPVSAETSATNAALQPQPQQHQQHQQAATPAGDAGDDSSDYFYELSWSELQSGNVHPALWAKSYANADGEDAKARAWYIRYRVSQLEAQQTKKTQAARGANPSLRAVRKPADQNPGQRGPNEERQVSNQEKLSVARAVKPIDDGTETLNCKCCNNALISSEISATGIATVVCNSCGQYSDVYTVDHEPILVKAHPHLTQSGSCIFCSDIGDTDAKLSDGSEYHESCYERMLLEFDELVEDHGADHRATSTYRAALHRVYDHWPDFPPDWAIRRQGKIIENPQCNFCDGRNNLELAHKTSLQRGGSNL